MQLAIFDAQQILLGLSLLRLKSTDLTVRDQINGIRQRVKAPCRQDLHRNHQAIAAQLSTENATLESGNKTHLDRIAELERENRNTQTIATQLRTEIAALKGENKTHLDRIAELERQHQNLQNLLTQKDATASNQRKRKQDDTELDDRGFAAKRFSGEAEIMQAVSQPDALVQSAIDELEDNILDNHASNTFLRQLYYLQILLGRKSAVSTDLASALDQIARTMIALVDNVLFTEGLSGSMQARRKNDKVLLRLLERTYRYLLQGLNKLVEKEHEVDLKNQVVHSFVQVYTRLVELIGSRSFYEVPIIPSSLPRRRSQRVSEGPAMARKFDDGDIMPLCRLYVTMLANLNPKKEIHREVAEGAFHALLTRVGNLLKMLVFGEEADVFGGSTGVAWIAKGKGKEKVEDITVAASEARFLVWILERVVHLQINLEVASQPSVTSKQRVTLAGPDSESLSHRARMKLQNTMLSSVFPDDKDNFEDRFRESIDPGLLLDEPLAAVANADSKNWFKQEVWRVISWDVLRRMVELEEYIEQ